MRLGKLVVFQRNGGTRRFDLIEAPSQASLEQVIRFNPHTAQGCCDEHSARVEFDHRFVLHVVWRNPDFTPVFSGRRACQHEWWIVCAKPYVIIDGKRLTDFYECLVELNQALTRNKITLADVLLKEGAEI